MRKLAIVLATVAMLAVVNWGIHAREQLLDNGRVVLLELAPVDPRSLLQGDYMALRFRVADGVFARRRADGFEDGRMVVALDARGVGAFRRIDDGTPLAADEARLRFRLRRGEAKVATNAFFFEEGRGEKFAAAQFGELRVAPDGEAILTGLRDKDLQPIAPGPAVTPPRPR